MRVSHFKFSELLNNDARVGASMFAWWILIKAKNAVVRNGVAATQYNFITSTMLGIHADALQEKLCLTYGLAWKTRNGCMLLYFLNYPFGNDGIHFENRAIHLLIILGALGEG